MIGCAALTLVAVYLAAETGARALGDSPGTEA
jgi:hypothetical protein